MSSTYSPRVYMARPTAAAKEYGLPKGFILGVAIAALIWAGLGVCTTISVSTNALAEAPVLTLSR